MNKTFQIAWREFGATVFTKGFLIGILMTPVMICVVLFAVMAMKNLKGPALEGEVAVIDRTGILTPSLTASFSPEAEKEALEKRAAEAKAMMESKMGEAAKMAGPQMDAALQQAMQGAKLTLKILPDDANEEVEKERVKAAKILRRDEAQKGDEVQRLALIVIPKGAVTPAADGTYEDFPAYFPERLDFEVQQQVTRQTARAIIDARVSSDARFTAGALKPEDVRKVMGQPRPKAITLSAEGSERKSRGELTMFVPMAFMILLMMSVLISGQSLLTSTVEEKSSRVMEVLLSAVSPMQLMVGKILGQLGVGLVILVLYSGVGMVGLITAAAQDMVPPMMLVYLLIYFLLSFCAVASMMAAVGSVVNDIKEAQTLMGPIMTVLMAPWLFWFLIQRAPNSTFATVLSFTPVINPWIMVVRLCGSERVPMWQIPASIAVALLTIAVLWWATAKIFRIGVLMYGKPPNFSTLIRWIRMA